MTDKPSDFGLWTDLAKTVQPLRRSRLVPSRPQEKKAGVFRAMPSMPPHPTNKARRPPASPPPITGLDRRTSQKLTRGNVSLEARLDLHGLGVEVARVRLLQFMRDASQQGLRTVLVITGKGDSPYARHTLHGSSHFDAPERQGRLRRFFSEWLHEAEFRALVSGYQPAHPKHGGGGAFYVRLRRA